MERSKIFILVGCEESQAITILLRKAGFSAFSCDLKPCSGGHPEWHIHGDVFEAIYNRYIFTQSGERIDFDIWHAGIFHPDCTFLTVSGLHWNKRVEGRAEKTENALQFVKRLMNCPIKYKAIENPIGCISTRIFKYCGGIGPDRYEIFPTQTRGLKPSQIIQPYNFGDNASKATALWLFNLPLLKNTGYFEPRITTDGKKRWGNQTDSGQNRLGPSEKRAELRSKTYNGIAAAIAKQWGDYLEAVL